LWVRAGESILARYLSPSASAAEDEVEAIRVTREAEEEENGDVAEVEALVVRAVLKASAEAELAVRLHARAPHRASRHPQLREQS
jgi:hypothetical protein